METFKPKEINLNTSQISDKIYGNKEINIFYSVKFFNYKEHDAFLLGGFTIALVTSGHATISIDGKQYELSRGNVLISTPDNITKNIMTSVDFDVAGLFVSSDFGKKVAMETHADLTMIFINRTFIVDTLNDTDQNLFIKYLETLSIMLNGDDNPIHEKALYSIFLSFSFFMADCSNADDQKEENVVGNNSAETIVKRFLLMLTKNNNKFLSVEEYADKLHITAKYLAAVCKTVTGKTPNQIKNEQIIREVKILLSNPNLSIKEIANILGFANPSHFGVFLRRNTGKSALELREEMKI